MIVKDEASTIEKTLASIKPFLDRWIVLDTGSTDDTRERVRRAMEGAPGAVHEAPFIDFATTRNHALDLCGDETEFILWLDADDDVVGGTHLREFLQRERGAVGIDREAYYVRVEASIRFDSARVFRSRAGWRFKGAVHEVLCHPNRQPPVHRVPNVLIRHVPTQVSAERSKKRWERDVTLLARALEQNPSDTRSAFYLAQTYAWLGRNQEANTALRRRIAMGGWYEEVYQSHMQLAAVTEALGRPWIEVLEQYLEAHAASPHRAEPLHAIAFHYNAEKQHALCLLFARRGLELPLPSQDRLFIDEEVYTWKLADLVGSSAFWVGAHELGEAAARQALRHRPNDPRLKANVEHYVEHKRRQKKPKGAR
jgi:tetratricopeptide (TPR) repeat protein